jgi:Lipopolysaccharide kinase (Kdo/WaaP) family
MPGVGIMEQGDIAWETVPSGELEEVPHGRLQEFRQDLEHIQESGALVVRAEAFAENIKSTKPINIQIINNIHRQVVSGGGRQLYLSPDFSWLGEDLASRFSVVRTAGAETSAHGVFFGLLAGEEEKWALPVAIKPFRKNPANAYADWLNNSLIAQTKQNHFEPVGFMIGEKINYSITELKQGAETLDNSDWTTALLDESNPEYTGQRALLIKVGAELGDFNARRIYHGDLQFKNIVIDVAGNVFFIDWESSSFYGDQVPEEVLMKKSAHDLLVLFGSMARSEEDKGVGLLHKFTPWMQWHHFRE